MQKNTEIRRFVQHTLGCSCPDEVFSSIDYTRHTDGVRDRKISVGNRLLVYLLEVDRHPDPVAAVRDALEQGIEERNNLGFNRFRLVLVTVHRDRLQDTAGQVFAASTRADDRTHLHIVGPEAIAEL